MPEEPLVGSGSSALEMDAATMRRLGYRVVDALVERARALRDAEPWRGGTREELETLFREPAPEQGMRPDDVLERALQEILPRAGRIDHPRFFAFVPSSPTWPSVLAAALSAGFNTFQGTWLESAGPSQVELVVLDWFRGWLGYPEGAGGVLTSGGSAANLDALMAARHHAGDPPDPVVYLSDQGHSSLERAARIVGVPAANVHRIGTDGAFRMDVGELRRAVARDRREGRTPLCVCANGGATNTGAVDPLGALAAVCREEGLWLHVDAAYGGFAILTEEGRRAFHGLEEADSVTLDPHKWLFQPYETGCLMVRDVGRLEAAFRIFPEYLQDTAMGARHVNFGDRGLQLTRTFRALRIWMSVKTFGMAAFREAIDGALTLTARAGAWIREREELELLSPPALGVVCFRFRPAAPGGPEAMEELNAAVQARIVEEGTAMMSSTRLRGSYALRLCILNHRSRWDDVRTTLDRVVEVGRELSGE